MKRIGRITLPLLLCAAIVVQSCSSDDGDNPVPPSTDLAGASIDFYNLYLEDSELIFQFEGTDVSSHLGYLWGSSQRTVQWNKSQSQVSLRVLRANDRTELSKDNVVLNDGAKYICFVTGDRPQDAFMQINEQDGTAPNEGLARMRMFHALPGDPSIDVYVGGTSPAHRLVSGLGWRSMSPYVELDPQALTDTLMIVEAGSAPIREQSLVFIANSNLYHAGKVYTLAAIRSQPAMNAARTALIIEQK